MIFKSLLIQWALLPSRLEYTAGAAHNELRPSNGRSQSYD
jgi:hypothetical protein